MADDDSIASPPSASAQLQAMISALDKENIILQSEGTRIARENNRIQFLLFFSSVASIIINVILVVYNISISNSTSRLKEIGASQVRPYLAAVHVDEVPAPDGRISVLIKNFGQTPAFEMFHVSRAFITPIDNAGRISNESAYRSGCGSSVGLSTSTLANGDERSVLINKYASNQALDRFDENDWASFINKTSALIISGTTCYKDGFGQQHFLNYCFAYRDFHSLAIDRQYTDCGSGNNMG